MQGGGQSDFADVDDLASLRGSMATIESVAPRDGMWISMNSPGQTVSVCEARSVSTQVLHTEWCGESFTAGLYWMISLSLITIWLLAGRTAISLVTMKGVPARISASRSSTTSASSFIS